MEPTPASPACGLERKEMGLELDDKAWVGFRLSQAERCWEGIPGQETAQTKVLRWRRPWT